MVDLTPSWGALPEEAVERMCLFIQKDSETVEHADYVFSADVRGSDPRRKERTMVVGQVRGLFRIFKNSGEVQLLGPMPGDPKGQRFQSAAWKIHTEWKAGKLPEKTSFVCG